MPLGVAKTCLCVVFGFLTLWALDYNNPNSLAKELFCTLSMKLQNLFTPDKPSYYPLFLRALDPNKSSSLATSPLALCQ